MPKKIFISYARTDRAVAQAVAQSLKSLEYDVWWDHSLLPADDFRTEITRNLEAADFVLVLWSPTSVSSQWVLDEAERGARSKKLIPVALGGVTPENVPIGLNQQQLIFCPDEFAASSEQFKRQLVEAITVLVMRGRPSVKHEGNTGNSTLRRTIAIALAALVISAIVGTLLWTKAPLHLSCKGTREISALPSGRWLMEDGAFASMTLSGNGHRQVSEPSGVGELAATGLLCERQPADCRLTVGSDRISIEYKTTNTEGGNSWGTVEIARRAGTYSAWGFDKFSSGGTLMSREEGTCEVGR